MTQLQAVGGSIGQEPGERPNQGSVSPPLCVCALTWQPLMIAGGGARSQRINKRVHHLAAAIHPPPRLLPARMCH